MAVIDAAAVDRVVAAVVARGGIMEWWLKVMTWSQAVVTSGE